MTVEAAEVLLPSMMTIVAVASLVVGYALGSEGATRAALAAWRTHRENRRLRADLVAERALVARVTAGTDDILAAARGSHRKETRNG